MHAGVLFFWIGLGWVGLGEDEPGAYCLFCSRHYRRFFVFLRDGGFGSLESVVFCETGSGLEVVEVNRDERLALKKKKIIYVLGWRGCSFFWWWW